MKQDIRSIAFLFNKSLQTFGLPLSLGHSQQLLAASLGYGSLASLQSSDEEVPGLSGANFMILDVQALSARAAALGYGTASALITDTVVKVIKNDPESPAIFLDPQDFVDNVVSQFANETVMFHDAVSDAAANTNAYLSEANLEPHLPNTALNKAVDFWEIPVEGTISMDQDPDRPFSGDKLLVNGVVRVWKVGRVCLSNDMELDVGAIVDDSYWEDDF